MTAWLTLTRSDRRGITGPFRPSLMPQFAGCFCILSNFGVMNAVLEMLILALTVKRKRKLAETEAEHDSHEAKRKALKASIEKESIGREQTVGWWCGFAGAIIPLIVPQEERLELEKEYERLKEAVADADKVGWASAIIET